MEKATDIYIVQYKLKSNTRKTKQKGPRTRDSNEQIYYVFNQRKST